MNLAENFGIGEREIKFRIWAKYDKKMLTTTEEKKLFAKEQGEDYFEVECCNFSDLIPMQYTGLKDKNGLTEIYEGDIIDVHGKITGNVFEMDKGETDLVIQGFGTKDWFETYNEAISRGCTNA